MEKFPLMPDITATSKQHEESDGAIASRLSCTCSVFLSDLGFRVFRLQTLFLELRDKPLSGCAEILMSTDVCWYGGCYHQGLHEGMQFSVCPS